LQNEIEDRRERMQRIRVGLTGLAVILLMVLMVTVVYNWSSGSSGSVIVKEKSGEEPLSDLGVAPKSPENSANQAAPTGKQP
jgi:hypothetical protein